MVGSRQAPQAGPRPPAGVRAAGRALRQSAGAVMMVRPAAFGWNPETAGSNAFQVEAIGTDGRDGRDGRLAVLEFDGLARALGGAGVEVYAIHELGPNHCRDAVFPNNWVTLHHDGTVVLYPMQAPARRLERRTELLTKLEEEGSYRVTRLVDLTHHELSGRFLEGTGSIVFDHASRMAYACRSPRTHEAVLQELCEELGYDTTMFDATDDAGVPVYHTNVLLAIGTRCVIVCGEAIAPAQREAILERLGDGGRRVVTIGRHQMTEFAGNALELSASGGTSVLAMSHRAWHAFDRGEQDVLRASVDAVVTAPVPTIELRGGGSVRCMLAEVFLPGAGVEAPGP